MNDPVTFAALDQFLRSLGFTERSVPESHVLFEHPGSGAVVILRPFKRGADVGPTTLGLIRHVLDEFGVMDRRVFDDAIRAKPVAG